jgi:exosome complex RNA-binding protein Csl4
MSIKIEKGNNFIFQATKSLDMFCGENAPFIKEGNKYVGTFTGFRDCFIFRSECEDEHLFSLSDEDFISGCKVITLSDKEGEEVDTDIIDNGKYYKEHSENLVRLTTFLSVNKLGKLGHDVVDEAIRLLADAYLVKSSAGEDNSSKVKDSALKSTTTPSGLQTKTCPTFTAEIYMAGDYILAKNIAREYCLDGFCVSFEKVDYIYTMGGESGFVCRVINYPRFPRSAAEIKEKATELAEELIKGLHQGSCSIVYSDETIFLTRREGDV